MGYSTFVRLVAGLMPHKPVYAYVNSEDDLIFHRKDGSILKICSISDLQFTDVVAPYPEIVF